ncbi:MULTISPECIES: sulfatase [unclassified Arenibacter]|uniref:sulfatase n=1 Tax=unclassified Arenibacter TaxID=2615047 RepID=UPI001C6E4B17|nr:MULTISPECIES: sulfatase [unclassified Arenibacter]
MLIKTICNKIHYRVMLVSLFLQVGCTNSELSRKPNIIFILADDLGWRDLGFMGSEFYETPNLDKLASESMVFTNAYAASPICSPSRAAILSGKHPARLHLTDWIPGNPPSRTEKLMAKPFKTELAMEEFTLAEAMQQGGYKTFFAGKWHLGEEAFYPEYHGFDINIGGNHTGHPSSYFSPYNNPQLPDGPDGEYLTDRLVNETISFMKEEQGNPFLAFLSFYSVHLPLQGKPEKVEKYRKKLQNMNFNGKELVQQGTTYFKNHQNDPVYAAMVESMDENIGRLLKAIKQLGLDKNTIIVFTSDNGGMATNRNPNPIPTSNLPLRAGKGHLYEGGIREPLIVCWPGRVVPGSRSDEPVTGTDFYPTFIDLAGIKMLPEQHIDGNSLKPALFSKERIDRQAIFWHYPHYSGGLGGRPAAAVRMGKYKLIAFFEDMEVELYDLETDISEQHDLSTKMPKKVKEMKGLLHAWRKEVGAQMPIPNPDYKE